MSGPHMPVRLDQMPTEGLIVVGPLNGEGLARKIAGEHGCDYFLDPDCPPESYYTFDVLLPAVPR